MLRTKRFSGASKKVFAQLRCISSFPRTAGDLHAFLSATNESSPSPSSKKYIKLLNHPEFQKIENIDTLMPTLLEFLSKDTSVEAQKHVQIHNTILENLLAIDSSLSTIHQREISKLEGSLTLKALTEVIKYNSGRVSSSWEIFNRHYNALSEIGHDLDQEQLKGLISIIIEKLIYGEEIDKLEDEPYVINKTSLVLASFLNKFLGDEEIKKTLVKLALKDEDFSLLKYIGIESFKDLQISDNANELLFLYGIWNPKSLTSQEIEENVEILSSLILASSYKEIEIDYNPKTFEILTALNKEYPLFQTSIEPIESTKLDLFQDLTFLLSSSINDSSLSFTPLRVSLLKSYGINKNQIQETLRLYNEFSVIDKYSVDILMTTMVIILSYQSVLTKNQSFLTIAETLTPQPIPIKALQSLILAKSQFNTDEALELYNDYIQKVSKTPGKDGFSPTTLLTESLLWGFISKRDREFAYLINDGALVNGLIEGDQNINRLKGVFKKYGEIVGEEDNDVEGMLHYEVLNALRRV